MPATVLRVLNSSSCITLSTTISDISLNYKLGNRGSERVRILLQIVSRLKRLGIISGLCDSRIHSLNISGNKWFWLSRSLQLSYIELNLRKTCMHLDNFHIFSLSTGDIENCSKSFRQGWNCHVIPGGVNMN